MLLPPFQPFKTHLKPTGLLAGAEDEARRHQPTGSGGQDGKGHGAAPKQQGSRLASPRCLLALPDGRAHVPPRPPVPPPPASCWVLVVIALFQVKTEGRGNNAQTKQSCQRGEETLSRQKVPLPNNILVSACTMLSCPAPLSRLYGKYYINGFVQIDS